jgi:hypothetical protein
MLQFYQMLRIVMVAHNYVMLVCQSAKRYMKRSNEEVRFMHVQNQ